MFHNNCKLQLIILFFLLFPLLSGCWDSQEIEQRATVLAIGIDVVDSKAPKEDEISHLKNQFPIPSEQMIKLTAQIAIPGRIPLGPVQTGGAEKPVLVMEVVGHTLDDAILNLQQDLADKLFLGHLRIIVLNEKVAKRGTQRFNDFLKRNPEIRRTASLVVSKEPAAKYMKLSPELERVPSLYLADMVDNLTALGKFPPSFIGLFWAILSSKGQDPILPYLALKKGSNIQLNGFAYFHGDRMVGKTSPSEIGVYMSIIGIKKGGYGAFTKIPGKEEMVLVRAVSRNTKIKVRIKDGNPHVDIKVRYESEIDEKYSPTISLLKSKMIRDIDKQASKDTAKSIRDLIKKTQKTKSDIFGFGEHFRAKLPSYWNRKIKTKENWDRFYKDLTFDVHVETNIHRVGMKAK
ncbi:Ger(x)C family spore germination protein [Neobacillus bataviensis]|uniref:Ger(x)C family spore germination protein n=1 Tax=Neobacillus bataviensis TaxID=220685 RepID=UPI001CBD86B8|nr:Ger(x)C family spore germination protein [Neobacillus bataviensis]